MTKTSPVLTPTEQRLAQMLKALGNPVRFQIVQILAEKQMCITGQIVNFTDLAQSTVSQHLKVLREAGLIEGEIDGPATCYCLDADGIRWLKEQIGNWLPDCCADGNPLRAYFEHNAAAWDELRAGYFSDAVRDAALGKAYLRPEMSVLDMGAGTGFMSAGLAPRVARVIAVDGSPAMLEAARKNLGGFSNVEFHLAESSAIPLPDGSVDAAFANMYLHHCPDPQAAIREMVRVLKPGGRLVITDLDTHPHAWLKEEMADVWQGFERAAVRAWFKDADLVNVLVDCTDQDCCAEPSKCGGESARISIFVAAGSRRLKMRDAVQTAYSARAEMETGCCGGEAQTSDCCSGSSNTAALCCNPEQYVPTQSVQFSTGYSITDLAEAPAEAGAIALGCGNPTAFANLRPGETVLDIGSGGGLDTFLAARKVGNSGRVIGVDMTKAMLKRARLAAKRAGILNVEFKLGQAEALPVEDNSVDVVISNCVINLCEDKAAVFREAFRVLRPGGRLEISDMVTSGAVSAESRQQAGEWADCVSGALPEQEYLDLVADAGFEEVLSRCSASSGQVDGVDVYSASVSARKPVTTGLAN